MVTARKLYRFVLVLIAACMLLIAGAGIVLRYALPGSPEASLKSARESISAARDVQAGKYAPDLYRRSEMLYDSAMIIWGSENRKFILFRNYKRVSSYAGESAVMAAKALTLAVGNAKEAHHNTAASLESISERIRTFEKLYTRLPLSGELRDKLNRSKIMMEEIRIARGKRDFHKAAELLDAADTLISKAEVEAGKFISDFFSNYEYWQSLVQKNIELSARNHSVLIVVDKLAHQLMLYRDGQLKSNYVAEFGPNWIGDKRHQGDQATPEGEYLVVKKKEKRHTRYYKALLLNYPNAEDLVRYKRNQDNGNIPKDIDVGGLIEIHGHGAKGFNWTNGCVALADRDMDAVYRQVSVNTPVVIVGSLVSMEQWINTTLQGK
jgi:hypothetical protein